MRNKFLILALAVPVALGGYIALHPGVALATPSYSQTTKTQVPGTYAVDPAHTSIGFEIGHLGLAKVQGRFTQKDGTLAIDKDLTKSGVEFTVQTKSVDTAVEPRDNHLRSADFFEVEKFPVMTFKSSGIRKASSGYVADGALTIKGVTKPVSISFEYAGPITDPWGGTRIGVVAKPFTINRKDFGIAYDQKLPDGTPSVSDVVTIHVALEATLKK